MVGGPDPCTREPIHSAASGAPVQTLTETTAMAQSRTNRRDAAQAAGNGKTLKLRGLIDRHYWSTVTARRGAAAASGRLDCRPPAVDVVLLDEQSEVVAQAQQPVEERPRLVAPADQRERVREPSCTAGT